MIISGWVYSSWAAEVCYYGLGWSLFGTFIGLILLLPAYAIGGMGAGDVKLLAGVGAWMHGTHTAYAFVLIGGRGSGASHLHGRCINAFLVEAQRTVLDDFE